MSFKVRQIGPGAAEVTGLDCAAGIDDAVFRQVQAHFLQYPVLVFRDQPLSVSAFGKFGRQFGRPELYPPMAGAQTTAALRQTAGRETPDQMLFQSRDEEGVLIMSNEPRDGLPLVGIVDNAETWHSDGSHKAEPTKAILLHAVKNPTYGGETEFCDLRAAYDALPPGIKAALQGATAAHHWSKSINPRFLGSLDDVALAEGQRIARLIPEMHQPVIRTHPETGRQSLYLSPRFTLRIDRVPEDDSENILREIFAFLESPQFCYRHQWQVNDLMIWDNRCLNHRVRAYSDRDVRVRHRLSIAGERVFFINPMEGVKIYG